MKGAARLDDCLRVLKTGDAETRIAAIRRLRQLWPQEAVAPLLETLRDENVSIQVAASQALAEIGSPEAISGLVEAFRAPRWHVRHYAKEALIKVGSPAAPALHEALQDERPAVRQGAAEVLKHTATRSSLEYLLVAQGDSTRPVRLAAIEALGRLQAAEAAEALGECLRDADSSVRELAAAGLGRLRAAAAVPGLLETLEDGSVAVRRASAVALGRILEKRAASGLLESVGDSDAVVEKESRKPIESLGADAVPALLQALNSPKPAVRRYATTQLGRLRAGSAVAPLSRILRDEERGIREGAASALVRIGRPSLEVLRGALRDRNPRVRRLACESLGTLGFEDAVVDLTGALKDRDGDVRRSAAEALGNIGQESGVERLLRTLGDDNPKVREAVVRALGEIGHPSAVPDLVITLKGEKDSWIGKVALEALKSIGTPATRALSELLHARGREDRKIAAWALGHICEGRAPPGLQVALRDPEPSVRRAAARSLAQILDVEAMVALKQVVALWVVSRGSVR